MSCNYAQCRSRHKNISSLKHLMCHILFLSSNSVEAARTRRLFEDCKQTKAPTDHPSHFIILKTYGAELNWILTVLAGMSHPTKHALSWTFSCCVVTGNITFTVTPVLAVWSKGWCARVYCRTVCQIHIENQSLKSRSSTSRCQKFVLLLF